jgi:hypothetical protein
LGTAWAILTGRKEEGTAGSSRIRAAAEWVTDGVMLNPPSVELGVLLRAVTGAEYLALLGSPSWGYDLLVGHLDQAEEAARDGCPWAQEFLSAYRLALAEYVRSLRCLSSGRSGRQQSPASR